MTKLIAATSILLLAALAACTSNPGLKIGNDGSYVSAPAHAAAAAGTIASGASE
jgi:hypothetical protein